LIIPVEFAIWGAVCVLAPERKMTDGIILCVDDDPTVLTALRALLSKLGPEYSVEIAESGAEALEIEAVLRENGHSLAVVISDFIMPGMRGDELLVRLHELNPNTIKIMLTGQSAFDGVKRAINQANLYRFLEKPFDNDDLLLTIKSASLAYSLDRALKRQNVELKELNAELEQMLARINDQQKELALSEAKATISTLVASVSHELGTPVGNSVMTSDMLVERVKKFQFVLDSAQLKRSELDEFVKSMQEGSNLLQKNLQRAVGLLQSFKQVAADQVSEQRRGFDLAAAVKEILITMAPSLRSKPHSVVVNIPDGILMDSLPGALGQVTINLINNAYLHAFEGMDDGVLTINGRQESGHVVIDFIDNGVGIPAANLARLLEPFFSTKIGHGGTGLGMSIVDNLVRTGLQGRLTVHSVVGEGTTFSIELPNCLASGPDPE
jgi:signal transduction histidine kinase